ncbi:PI-actitoxin-Aeq3a-like [Amblyomma americanum]
MTGLFLAFFTMKTPTCFLYALLCLTVVLVQGYKRPKYCEAESNDGQCGGEQPSIERWYYDVSYGYCGPFLWGGCGGNNNNFPNCTACMTTCSNHPNPEDACRYIINSP